MKVFLTRCGALPSFCLRLASIIFLCLPPADRAQSSEPSPCTEEYIARKKELFMQQVLPPIGDEIKSLDNAMIGRVLQAVKDSYFAYEIHQTEYRKPSTYPVGNPEDFYRRWISYGRFDNYAQIDAWNQSDPEIPDEELGSIRTRFTTQIDGLDCATIVYKNYNGKTIIEQNKRRYSTDWLPDKNNLVIERLWEDDLIKILTEWKPGVKYYEVSHQRTPEGEWKAVPGPRILDVRTALTEGGRIRIIITTQLMITLWEFDPARGFLPIEGIRYTPDTRRAIFGDFYCDTHLYPGNKWLPRRVERLFNHISEPEVEPSFHAYYITKAEFISEKPLPTLDMDPRVSFVDEITVTMYPKAQDAADNPARPLLDEIPLPPPPVELLESDAAIASSAPEAISDDALELAATAYADGDGGIPQPAAWSLGDVFLAISLCVAAILGLLRFYYRKDAKKP